MTRLGLLVFTITTACSGAHREMVDASATQNDADASTSDGALASDAGAVDAGSSVATTVATDVRVCTIDSVNVYCVTSPGALWSQSKASGAQTSLLSFGSNSPGGMATDGTTLYLAGDGYIESMPVAGGTAKGLLGDEELRYGGGLVLLDAVLYVRDLETGLMGPAGSSWTVVAVPIGGVPVVGGEQNAWQ